jgi:hypothetical protein
MLFGASTPVKVLPQDSPGSSTREESHTVAYAMLAVLFPRKGNT